MPNLQAISMLITRYTPCNGRLNVGPTRRSARELAPEKPNQLRREAARGDGRRRPGCQKRSRPSSPFELQMKNLG
jgi:hypothetical protein